MEWYETPLRGIERKWGLQTRLPKGFAEKLSTNKIKLLNAIVSRKRCLVASSFYRFSRRGQGVELVWVSPTSKQGKRGAGSRWKGLPWTRA